MPPGEALGVDLASHVGEREAAAFTAALRTDSELPSHLSLSDMLAAVQAAAREVLGPEARAELAGSLAKGTATSSSDADVLVHSVAPVTLAQRQALEARLRAHPAAHPEHVRLRKLAIHARLFNIDCDVVCADTVEYGSCPGVDERVAADVTVARAAQALKFWASHAAARDRKLPGHALEAVALYVGSGDGARARPKAGDGVMQLFVAVLQQLADAARDGEASVLRRVTRLDAPTRADLSRHARATLHVFVLTRALARGRRGDLGFRGAGELRAWLAGDPAKWLPTNTPAGQAPGWLVHSAEERRAADPAFAVFPPDADEDGTEDSEALREAASSAESLRHLCHSPLGAYLQPSGSAAAAAALKGSGLATAGVSDEVNLLARLAEEGSAVADRMLDARTLWMSGETAMRDMGRGHEATAVKCFADALRVARADGDPFSGWLHVGKGEDQAVALARYAACADAVLHIEPENWHAMLIRAWALTRAGRLAEAEAVLSAAVERGGAADVLALSERATLRGNMGRWRDSLADSVRCAQLCPDEPIYHYWEGVARHQCLDRSGNAGDVDAARAAFRRFLAAASPEGRKVCEALYALALLEMHTITSGSSKVSSAGPETARIVDMVRQAQAAEAKRLPVFAPVNSQTKAMAVSLLRLIEAPRDAKGHIAAPPEEVLLGVPPAGPARAAALRAKGNKAFGAKDFGAADEHYSAALLAAPGDAELLANRAAARLALRWFTAAGQDAAAAAAARPGWVKPHYRAALAHLGRRDGAAALTAARAAAALSPDDANVARVLADAETAAQRVIQPPPQPRSNAELWGRVSYKGNVATVSPTGGATFACLADALQQLVRPGAGGATLVLHPGVYDEQPMTITDNKRVQILGWHAANTATRAELRFQSDAQTDGPTNLVSASGAAADVALERLLLTHQASSPAGHSVRCHGGATVRVMDCSACTPDSPAFAVDGKDSRLSLVRVAVRRSGAALIADACGTAECDECIFAGCGRTAVEARGGGAVVLRGCSFSKCNVQAASLYRGGSRLELHGCTIRACGKRPTYSAVLACCGNLLLRRCVVEDNPADGVVLQCDTPRDSAPPLALVDSCTFARNDTAVCVYGANGLMSRCTVRDHAMLGATVNGVTPHKQFTFRGCTFENNGMSGGRIDISVLGHTLMEHCVRIEADNSLSTPPRVILDSAAASITEYARAGLSNLGMDPSVGASPAPEGSTSPTVGWQQPREQLIEHHLEAVKRQTRGIAEDERLVGMQDNSRPEGRKVSTHPSPPLASLTPIAVRELRPGKTHNGRVLRGTLLVPPLAQAGLMTLLRDDAGDVTKLALYGALPPVAFGDLLGDRARAAARLLPEGARVGVAEPFFKLMADGTYGVRVDNPQELTVVLPRDTKNKQRAADSGARARHV